MGKELLKLSITSLPFKTNLSFCPLINHLKEEVAQNGRNATFAAAILERIQGHDVLIQPSISMEVIEQNRDLVDLLMTSIFPPVVYHNRMSIAAVPFDMDHFYATPKYKELFENEGMVHVTSDDFEDERWRFYAWIMHVYILIFKQFYDFDLCMDNLFVYQVTDKHNGLEKYFKVEVSSHCILINLLGELKPMSQSDIQYLINHPFDIDLWLERLPLSNFEFSGFVQVDFIDVTQLEVISCLKSNLLEKFSIINPENFASLEMKIRSLLGLPNVKLGITALHYKNGVLDNPTNFWNGLMCDTVFDCMDYQGSFYEMALKEGRTILKDDISKESESCALQSELLNKGICNVSVTPLYYEDELVGVLELGSTKAHDINFTQLKKIKDIIPVFSIALKRSTEELRNRIQATIKEECTAIHPSVEWRFQQAAARLLAKRDLGENAKMEEIVFSEVYPLYGAVDIRSSSSERNKSIQKDLIEQMQLAKEVLELAYNQQQMPILDQLIYKLDNSLKVTREGLSSGDESTIVHFLQSEVEPIFVHLIEAQPSLKTEVERYLQELDPQLKIVYKQRKAFEKSLQMLNSCLTQCSDQAQDKAQAMFPHYFEKYRTDGLEHNIYMGASLCKDKIFNSIYLKNIRLWQLILSCEMSRLTHAMKSELPIPLDTTALILVHGEPLSIRFRQDEKKFDVDGSYNIRYEIIKKRIDKALIRTTKQRLTQPGTLSVIFSQERHMDEYVRYVEYLSNKGYFKSGVERVLLEDLQGVYGLRALRMHINFEFQGGDVLSVVNDYAP